MLYAQSGDGPRVEIKDGGATQQVLRQAIWVDLMQPTPEERSLAQSIVGQQLPERADLEEIQSSRRLYTENGALFMSMPLLTTLGDRPSRSPIGFVLTKDHLVTLRYEPRSIFDTVSARFAGRDATPCSGMETIVSLLEAMVDRDADALERIGVRLDGVSDEQIAEREESRGRVRLSRTSRVRLQEISRAGDTLSGLRDSLLGLSRIVGYVPEAAPEWVTPTLAPHFATLRADLASLADYQTRLQDKAQFLLDATLGFINIDQNDIFRILTVVSVVGIPPTLIASIYGMNFKDMPELDWPHGYYFALAVIWLSALVPLWLFRKRGWL
jgi:magnesium transporter